MMIERDFIWMLLGVSLVTLVPRVLPMMLVSRFELPQWLLKFLQYVPIAVMTALLAQSVLVKDETWIPLFDNLNLIVLIPTLIAAIWTRSLLVTVLVGVFAMWLLQILTP